MQRCVVWLVCATRRGCVGWGGGCIVFCCCLLGCASCVGVCSGVCGGGLRTQERVLYYFYAYMFCKLWSDSRLRPFCGVWFLVGFLIASRMLMLCCLLGWCGVGVCLCEAALCFVVGCGFARCFFIFLWACVGLSTFVWRV